MATFHPKVRSTRVEGVIESLYITFQENSHAHETIPFSRADGARLLVDVDDNDFPVGMQFVEPIIPSDADPDEAVPDFDKIFRELFAFANQMVAYHRANQQAKGNALIIDALSGVRHLLRDEDNNLVAT